MNAKEPRAPEEERQGVVGFCRRMLGLLWTGGRCAFGRLFAHQEVGMWGFSREKWGSSFLFFVRGGLRKKGPRCV